MNNYYTKIESKRQVLITTKLRFSPETQPVKDSAIDKIIENILYFYQVDVGCTKINIQDIYFDETGGYSLIEKDLDISINRLINLHKVVIPDLKNDKFHYKLEEKNYGIIKESILQREKLIIKVIENLFKDYNGNVEKLYDPFTISSAIIFSQIGEESVRLLSNDAKIDDLIKNKSKNLNQITEEVCKKFEYLDKEYLESKLIKFFNENNPDFNYLKWYLAQNYFIAKTLGLGKSNEILSKEFFENADFYLDTNILVIASEPNHKYHKSFKAFANACNKLHIDLLIAEITIVELKNWVHYQEELFQKVVEEIPFDLKDKISSFFFDIYKNKLKNKAEVSIDEVFENFRNSEESLKKNYNVFVVQDEWFKKYEKNPQIHKYASQLQVSYEKLRQRRKKYPTAIHDALLLNWVNKKKLEDENVTLISDDNSLALEKMKNSDVKLSITLDTIIQWIQPITPGSNEEDFSDVFSESLRYRILPHERFLELTDFLIFHDMQISCNELPADDVESCILYLKKNCYTLDPNNSKDREKMMYEVRKFFINKNVNYQNDISRLEKENRNLTENFNSTTGKLKEYEGSNIDLKGQVDEYTSKLSNSQKEIEDLKSKTESLEKYVGLKYEDEKKLKIRNSGIIRLILVIIIYTILTFGLTYIINILDNDVTKTLYQKITNGWGYYTALTVIALTLGGFFIGKDRLKALSLHSLFNNK